MSTAAQPDPALDVVASDRKGDDDCLGGGAGAEPTTGDGQKPKKIKQHMVTECLIKRWADDSTGLVQHVDLRDDYKVKQKPPGGIMYLPTSEGEAGFVPLDHAQRLEPEWSRTIEQAGCEAIVDLIAGSSIGDNRAAILDLMALHLLRSSETRGRFNMTQGKRANELLEDVTVREEFRQAMAEVGMSAAETEDVMDQAIRSPGGFAESTHRSFAENLPEWLARYREYLSECGLLVRKTDSPVLLLGDGPAFLTAGTCFECETTTMFGMLDRIARCPAHVGRHSSESGWHAWMPLTPQVVAQASPHIPTQPAAPQTESLRCFPSQAGGINKMECRRAQFRVAIPPRSEQRSVPFVRRNARPAPQGVSAYKRETPPPDAMWRQ